MSYSAKIYFKNNIHTISDLFQFIDSVKKSFSQTDFLELHRWFFQDELLIYNFESDRLKERFIREHIAKTILTFLYFPNYSMAGLVWNGQVTENFNQLFDTYFFFQDGSDQNYALESYLDFSQQLQEDVSLEVVSEQEIKEALCLDDDDFLGEWEYYQLTYKYKLLLKHLGLDNLFFSAEENLVNCQKFTVGLFDQPDYSLSHRKAICRFVEKINKKQ